MTRSLLTHCILSEPSVRAFAKTCQGREGKGREGKGRESAALAVHHIVTAVTRARGAARTGQVRPARHRIDVVEEISTGENSQ